jgi:hypothetical protein
MNRKCTKVESFLLDVKWTFIVKINYGFHSNTKFHLKTLHMGQVFDVIKVYSVKSSCTKTKNSSPSVSLELISL